MIVKYKYKVSDVIQYYINILFKIFINNFQKFQLNNALWWIEFNLLWKGWNKSYEMFSEF